MENTHIPASAAHRLAFMRRTIEAMYPYASERRVTDEPTVVYGSDEYNARVWFDHGPDEIIKFRFFGNQVQITSEVNA
jgi:hypothetical protein